MKVSIVIPCYNERNSIQQIVEAVKNSPVSEKEIIVVEDFSKDGTREYIKTNIESLVDKVIYHEKNMGKGAALRTGFQAATGDIVLVQDADLEYNPQDYPKLIEPFIMHNADVVYGSRFLLTQSHQVYYFWHMLINRMLTLFSNMCSNLHLTDMETCYKVFKRQVIQSIQIEENRFGFEPEITAKLAKKRLNFYEVGISYNPRGYKEGKKIGWKDGLRTLYAIMKYNFFKH